MAHVANSFSSAVASRTYCAGLPAHTWPGGTYENAGNTLPGASIAFSATHEWSCAHRPRARQSTEHDEAHGHGLGPQGRRAAGRRTGDTCVLEEAAAAATAAVALPCAG